MKGRFALRIQRLLPILVLILAVCGVAPLAAAAEKYAAIVYDANSGKTLFSRNADDARYPASLTKMMTLYILFEELKANRLTLKSRLDVSATAAAQAPSKLGLKAGSTVSVEDAIMGLTTKSANDAAVVVAENVSGSVGAFAARMTRTAHALGMTNTNYRNPNGLPNTAQTTTARDLVFLARALQDRFPEYYKYFGVRTFTYKGKRYRNHNHLLGSVEGVDGIKTGYTRASGFNLVTNVERDGRHIIAVVMGGRTGRSRDAHMRELIASYLPKGSRKESLAPLLVATGPAGTVAAHARKPRARPDMDEDESSPVLAYAADEGSHDLVGAALAAAARAENVTDTDEDDDTEDLDPIAARISVATEVAALATAKMPHHGRDPIARLTEMARERSGRQQMAESGEDVIAAAPLPVARPAVATAANMGDDDGWNIQIGAVDSAEGAQALIEKAQASMGQVLASLQPVTQEVERGGTTLYRARFAGFSDKVEARATCDKLKRKSFACLAVPN